MRTSSQVVAMLLVTLAAVPVGAPQATVDVHGLVLSEFSVRTPNATVQLSQGVQFVEAVTNASGGFVFYDLAPGTYRARIHVPDESGEQWTDRNLTISGSSTFLTPLRLNRTLPHLAREPTLVNTTAGTLVRGQHVGYAAQVQNPTAGTNQTVVIVARLRNATQDVLTHTSAPLTIRNGTRAWINATLDSMSSPYSDTEGNLTLHLDLRLNATDVTTDRPAPLTFRITGSCAAGAQTVTLRLGLTDSTFCAAAAEAAAWVDWETDANAFLNASRERAEQAAAAAAGWTPETALEFWRQYTTDNTTQRAAALARLDAAQTDQKAQPNWTALDALRQTVTLHDEKIRSLVYTSLEDGAEGQRADTTMAHVRWTGFLIGGLVAGLAVGAVAAQRVSLRWKREMEYWIGYTSQAEPRTPLRLTLILAAVCLVTAVAILLVMGTGALLRALGG